MFFGFSRAVGDVGMRAIIVTECFLFQRTKNFISCRSSEAHALFATRIELTLSLFVDVETFERKCCVVLYGIVNVPAPPYRPPLMTSLRREIPAE